MTENFIVFVEQPLKLDMVKLATAYFRGVTWGSCLKFDKDDIVSPESQGPGFGLRCNTASMLALFVVFTDTIAKYPKLALNAGLRLSRDP